MRKATPVVVLALAAAGAVLASAPPGRATVRMQERASELGFPADDCAYCHTFSREHMTRHAREAGLRSTNCVACHAGALPLEGVELYNERGRYLLDVKEDRGARRCDMRWLAGYVEEEQGEEGDDAAQPDQEPDPGP